jgi:hypothetical protein
VQHLRVHLTSLKVQLEQIASAIAWLMRSFFSMIFIPVRIAGNWCLYQIMLRLIEVPLNSKHSYCKSNNGIVSSNNENTSPQRPNLGQETQIRDNDTLEERWNRLKRYITGCVQLAELEGRLLTNDRENLGLNPFLPTYPPLMGVVIT